MPLTPPEFLEYSRYLQHEVEPESRRPEGLQELLGSGLFWGNPERGPTLGLAWYSLGETLLVDSAGVSKPSQLEELLPELLGEPCRFETVVRVTRR
ncbi:MAG TPA: hypothetical protein VK539_35860 [Myxococcaceae bacterium]|nr:hypothetical protein [Myxococcaceae bacterium]